MQWALQAGTIHRSKNNNGEPIVIGIVRGIDVSNNTNEVYQIYVPRTACAQNGGRVVLITIGGKFVNEFNYVNGQGSVAADLAEVVCITDGVINPVKQTKPAKTV